MSPPHSKASRSEPQQDELQSAALAQLLALESVRAPDSLHRAVEQMIGDATTHSRRRLARRPPARPLPPRLAGATALAIATAAVLAIVLGSRGQPAPPTVLQASRVALAPATLPAPVENPHEPGTLDASVEGLAYPYWGGRRGWPAAGARHDRLSGRAVTAVFYAAASGTRIGYAIVAGRPLAEPTTGTQLVRGGARFRVLSAGGATVVTWREDGHTCILAARDVPARTMVRLALS